MKHKRLLLILVGNLIAVFILLSEAKSQQDTQGYIYGRISTIDNQYEGLIRWGKEEAFWNDYFNASKVKNQYYDALEKRYEEKQSTDWSTFNWDFNSIWRSSIPMTTHQFVCQFGDIQSFKNFYRSRVDIVLKNGEVIELDGEGYNDIGTTVYVQDRELGEIAIKWEKIRQIDFMSAPRRTTPQHGMPIFGMVETFRKGTFTGFIQWDHDERLSMDKLDGDSKDGKVSIPFSEIKYIEKSGNGSIVRTHSGRELYLTNSNDVNTDNRGIIVTVPGIGAIDIPWRFFKSLTMIPTPDSGPGYEDYGVPKGLSGTVYTLSGEEFSGSLLYDLDEAWELETLDSYDEGVKYTLPLRHVKAVIPKNIDYSMVELRNGDKLLLGGSRDVGSGHAGVLVFVKGKKEPVHIRWRNVSEIVFD